MIFEKNREFSKIMSFSDSDSQDGIDRWELLEVAGRPPGGERRPQRPRRAAQSVARRCGTLKLSGIIIQTRWKCPQAMLIDQGRIFIKCLFFEESVVFDRLEVLRSLNLL